MILSNSLAGARKLAGMLAVSLTLASCAETTIVEAPRSSEPLKSFTIEVAKDSFVYAQLSPDASSLAVSGTFADVPLYSTLTGEVASTSIASTKAYPWVAAPRFSADGSTFLVQEVFGGDQTGSFDWRVFNAASGANEGLLRTRNAFFSSNSNELIAGMNDRVNGFLEFALRKLDARNGDVIHNYDVSEIEHAHELLSVNPDGSKAILESMDFSNLSQMYVLYDLESERLIDTILGVGEADYITHVEYLGDKIFILGSRTKNGRRVSQIYSYDISDASGNWSAAEAPTIWDVQAALDPAGGKMVFQDRPVGGEFSAPVLRNMTAGTDEVLQVDDANAEFLHFSFSKNGFASGLYRSNGKVKVRIWKL
jgi:hypothetical protein